MKKLLTILLTLMLLISASACAQNEPEVPTEPEPGESLLWETMPQLTYGVMEYEKLDVLPWYSGRAEAANSSRWAETKDGFYMTFESMLYYADKTDLAMWIPVCNKPQCSHPQQNFRCNAYIGWGSFFIRDNRINFIASMDRFQEVVLTEARENALFSKALNGTDVRLEYAMESEASVDGGMDSCYIVGPYWLYHRERLNTDGSYTETLHCYDVRDGSLKLWFKEISSERTLEYLETSRSNEVFGDYAAKHPCSDGNLCRIEDGMPVLTNTGKHTKADDYFAGDLSDYLAANAGDYLSGNVLRQFRMNDGYYDINLETGEEVFLAEPRLENSRSFIVLPNCILETTLGNAEQPEGTLQAMELFDGESWRKVTLPPELDELYNPDVMQFGIGTVASDRIFVLLYTTKYYDRYQIYQIRLDQEELTMEYVTEMR